MLAGNASGDRPGFLNPSGWSCPGAETFDITAGSQLIVFAQRPAMSRRDVSQRHPDQAALVYTHHEGLRLLIEVCDRPRDGACIPSVRFQFKRGLSYRPACSESGEELLGKRSRSAQLRLGFNIGERVS